MANMDIYRTTPQESGTMTIRGREVSFLKCQERFMGEPRYFWRADCGGETIATGCKTKADCIKDARAYLRRKGKQM